MRHSCQELPAFSMAALDAMEPSSVARRDFKAPLKQPTGVLTALAMTTSCKKSVNSVGN